MRHYMRGQSDKLLPYGLALARYHCIRLTSGRLDAMLYVDGWLTGHKSRAVPQDWASDSQKRGR